MDLSIVILAVAGYFHYQSYVVGLERKERPLEAMWKAEEYFRMDSSEACV